MPQVEMKHAAVLGWPVGHSLSPRLHNYWLKQYDIKGVYEAIAVQPASLEGALHQLADKGFSGVNLTIPHKETGLLLMETLDQTAKSTGAVNTVIINNGKLQGLNTDTYGFMAAFHAKGNTPDPAQALILGAGGAARAVCLGLLQEGWRVILATRTREKAEAIRANFDMNQIAIIDWEKLHEVMNETSLLVNTTPLGMKGQPPLEIPLEALAAGAWVYDIVYTPESPEDKADPTITPLLIHAHRHGHTIISGLGMLLYQAQPAFEAWFGVRPAVTEELFHHMRDALS